MWEDLIDDRIGRTHQGNPKRQVTPDQCWDRGRVLPAMLVSGRSEADISTGNANYGSGKSSRKLQGTH